jgi:hypothetical protein
MAAAHVFAVTWLRVTAIGDPFLHIIEMGAVRVDGPFSLKVRRFSSI